MSIDVTAGNELELWHVQLGGSVRTMTLDELDHAFQSGVIDERTMVLKAGALHWTTLGDIAGIATIDGPPPNSIAPMATDIASSDVLIPSLPTPAFDTSFGTAELAVFRPKRRLGPALAAFAAVALVAGAAVGVKTYGIDNLQAKVASVTSLAKGTNAESARSAAGVSAPTAEPANEPASAPPPAPMAVENLPTAKPVAPVAPGVSIDSLPSAPPAKADKADKADKKRGKTAPKKKASPAKAKSKASSDPTQRGGGQFDPLNGSL